MIYCSQCGAQVVAGRFCEECGAPLEVAEIVESAAPTVQEPLIQEERRTQTPEPDSRVSRRSRSRLPLILGGVGLLILLAVGGWFLQQAKVSPLVLDPFPGEEAGASSPDNGSSQPAQAGPLQYLDFVGNWIVTIDGVESEFWIQEVENRYVGADDFTIMEFSGIEDRTMKGVISDGPHVGAHVQVILSADGNAVQFILTQDQQPEIRYDGVRNTSLGQGTITTDDISAMEIMVKNAYRDIETAQDADKAEKEAAYENAIIELGNALHTYYVVEGKRELSEARTHLYEYLMTMNVNGFGMTEDYIKEMVDVALSP